VGVVVTRQDGGALAGDVVHEMLKKIFRQSTGGRHQLLALPMTSELALLALETVEEVFLTVVTSGWFESLGEPVTDHVSHRPGAG